MPLPSDPVAWAVDAFTKDGKNARYDTLAAYIDGDQPLAFASEKFRSAFGRLFSAFAYNRCEMVTDAHADRLQVQGIGADDDAVGTAAQGVWDENHMDLREGHAEVDSVGLGDSHLIVEMHPEREQVMIWVQDPRTVRVHYADDVPGERDLAAKMWIDDDTGHARLNLYTGKRVEKFITQSRATSVPTTATAFTRYEVEGQDQSFDLEASGGGVVPVFHIANNGRTNNYGRSEIVPVMPLQDAINKTLMDMLVAAEFAAFPQRVFIGMEVPEGDDQAQAKFQQIETGITRAIALESPEAKIAEFSAADLGQYLNVVEFFDTAISRVTKVPVHYLGMRSDFPSGRALRLAEGPFVAKLQDRARAIGNVYSEALAYALRLQGMTQVTPGDLRVNWAPLAPSSEEDVWDLIMQKRTAGLALVSALREAGYEPDQIDTLENELNEEAERTMRRFDAGMIDPRMDEEVA